MDPKETWKSTPNELRHAKRLELTLLDDERAILERLGGGAGSAGRDKSAVVGAALHVLMRLPGEEILKEIEAARAKRKNR